MQTLCPRPSCFLHTTPWQGKSVAWFFFAICAFKGEKRCYNCKVTLHRRYHKVSKLIKQQTKSGFTQILQALPLVYGEQTAEVSWKGSHCSEGGWPTPGRESDGTSEDWCLLKMNIWFICIFPEGPDLSEHASALLLLEMFGAEQVIEACQQNASQWSSKVIFLNGLDGSLIVYSARQCMCLIAVQSCFKERGRRQTRKLKSLTFWRRRWAPQKYWQKNPAVPGRLQSGRQGAGCCPEDGGGGRSRQWERLGHQVWQI